LSEPPKERFDRVIVDKKIANREGHLRELRKLIKKVRAFDQRWTRSISTGRRPSKRAARKNCSAS
jgi:hypothetical protein